MNHYTYMLTVKNPVDTRRFYVGVRSCKVEPEQDVKYLGSCRPMKAWMKTQPAGCVEKMVLSRWESRADALAHEILLHDCFDVGANPEFWNQARQTSIGFHFDFTGMVRGKLSEQHRTAISKTKAGVSWGSHAPETTVKQKGTEYHCPNTNKTVRFKTHLGEAPPQGWVKGRALLKKRFWMTDGIQSKPVHNASDVPANWYRGRTTQRSEKGQFV